MSGSNLYRSVLRGKQELVPGGPMSPISSLALSLHQRANLSHNTPKSTLSLPNSDMTPTFFTGSKLSTNIFHDNSEMKSPTRRLFSSPSRDEKSPSRRVPSRDKENCSSPYFSPSPSSKSRKSFASSPSPSSKSRRPFASPLKDVKNTCQRNLNFSPFKRILSPAKIHSHTNTPNKINTPEDCDASSQDSGYSSEKKYDRGSLSIPIECAPRKLNLDLSPSKSKTSQTFVKSTTSESRLSSRSFSSLSSLSMLDEDTILMDLMYEDGSTEENQPKGFSSLLSAPINSNSSGITAKTSPCSPKSPAKPTVQRRISLFDQPRFSIKKCASMMDTTPFRTAIEINTSPITSRVPVIPLNIKKDSSDSLTFTFKRPQPPIDLHEIMENKRRKLETRLVTPSCVKTGSTTISTTPTSAINVFRVPPPVSRQSSLTSPTECPSPDKQRLFRSSSESQVSIMKSLSKTANTQEKLTGDHSRPIALPTIKSGEHPDLPTITSETLADLINGKYNGKINSYEIVDCRYPYEFDGGHIQGAVSWHNPQMVNDYLSKKKDKPVIPAEDQKRDILIFHCEFSQKRGPYAQRMLRSQDRTANYASYPALQFPEMYLLEGGYKVFYQQHPKLCTPQGYVQMLEKKYSDEYKHFRAKSKSWANESRKGGGRITPSTAIKKLGL